MPVFRRSRLDQKKRKGRALAAGAEERTLLEKGNPRNGTPAGDGRGALRKNRRGALVCGQDKKK